MTWHPIETAPKDDRRYLLLWEPSKYGLVGGMYWIGRWNRRRWREYQKGWPLDPSHWQPLPAPPEAEG